jgi:hypothetical protein
LVCSEKQYSGYHFGCHWGTLAYHWNNRLLHALQNLGNKYAQGPQGEMKSPLYAYKHDRSADAMHRRFLKGKEK